MEKAFQVRLTEEEYKALEAYAERCGISRNKAVKRLILGEAFTNCVLEYFNLSKLEDLTGRVRAGIFQQLKEQKTPRR